AFAAREFAVKAVIVVPRGNSREKNEAMRALGAELIEHGETFHDADHLSEELAASRNLFRISAFEPILVQGVGTYGLELFKAVSNLDAVYVPIGWGSGACGVAAARNGLSLNTKIVGVVSREAPTSSRSFAARQIVEIPPRTRIADGVAVARPNPGAFDLWRNEVERIVEVSDDEVE